MLYGDLFVANVSIDCICLRPYIGKALLVRQGARSALWRRVQWLFYEYCDHKQREQTDDAQHGTGSKCARSIVSDAKQQRPNGAGKHSQRRIQSADFAEMFRTVMANKCKVGQHYPKAATDTEASNQAPVT